MPPNKKDENPEYPFPGPFGGLQSEVAPSQIGNTGFAEVQNILFRNSTAQILPAFTPVTNVSPDGNKILGIFDFFDLGGARHSGVFTQRGMFAWQQDFFGNPWRWAQIMPATTPLQVDPGPPPAFLAPGVAITGPPLPIFFFQTAVVGYKLYFSRGVDPIQVWDGRSPFYYTADWWPIPSPPGFIPTHVLPVPAVYLMELDFHLLVGNTTELIGDPLYNIKAAPQMVHWSATFNGAIWSDFSSGLAPLLNNLGPITGMTRLYQSGYIWQYSGITQAVPTGDALQPFRFITMGAYAKGNTFRYSLAAFGELIAAYVGRDDIYVFDGTSSQPIGQHPIDGNRRLGARTRIFADLFKASANYDQSLNFSESQVWGVITTAANATTYESYWLFIPELNKAWVYNFDESNWAQMYFPAGRLQGPAISTSWFSQLGPGLLGFTPVDSLVIADNLPPGGAGPNVSYLDFTRPGSVPTVSSINPGDGWYIRSGTLDFDDNRHPHTVNKLRFVFTDIGVMQFYLRLYNEAGYVTPTQLFTLGEGKGGSLTTMVDLQNGITGKYITWELSGPPGVPFELVEITPYPIPGGEVMTRCEVVLNPPVLLPPTPITITPGSATLAPGETQQFTASESVTWIASSGTITATGLFTAPTVSVATVVTITAVGVATGLTAQAQVSVQPTSQPIVVTVAPQTVTLVAGQTQTFTATLTNTVNVSVTWTATQGTITAAGVYTASTGTTSSTQVTVTATSVADPTRSGQAIVTVNPVAVIAVSISPVTVSLTSGQSQQFTQTVSGTTNQNVTWTASPSGTITTAGLYTAGTVTVATNVTITATSVADTTKSAHVTCVVNPAASISVTISPTSATVISAHTQQFTATVTNATPATVTWMASQGTITSGGLYTAPTVTTATSVTVTATSVADTSKKAQVTVTVNPAIVVTVTPAAVVLAAGASQQFSQSVTGTTNQAVTWTASLGTITAAGLYTAPSTVTVQTTATVTATSVADASKSAQAAVTINPVISGELDLLQWCILSTRATQHLAGDPKAPYEVQWLDTDAGYPANYPKNTLWFIKNKLGNPWDVLKYDTQHIWHWMTENGDAPDQAACQAANGTTCWMYAKAYKRAITQRNLMPRYFMPNTTITLDTAAPTPGVRTTNCESTTTATNLGPIHCVTTGPFKISWGGSIDHGTGTLADKPNYDPVNGVDTIKNSYQFTHDATQPSGFADIEETYYVKGFGRVAWYHYVKGVFQQKTVNTTVVAGGHPAPNFPCGPGKSWFV